MIGDKIRDLAQKKGLTLKELAFKSDIAEPTLHNILTRNDAKVSQIDKIADILEVSSAYLLGETQERKVETPNNENTLLREMVEELKSTNDFLKSLVLSKLDRLEKYNFGMNDEKLGKYREFALGVGVFR